ncbi:MAG: hypothetical protein ACOYOK_15865 [Pseudobdellovibrionaceae bacterium]|jgi:hypothetical protein
MSLDKAMKNMRYDKRLTQWHLNNGQMTKEDLKAHLESLPDLSHNADFVSIDADSDLESVLPEPSLQ